MNHPFVLTISMLVGVLSTSFPLPDSPASGAKPAARMIFRNGKLVDCRDKTTVGLREVERQFTRLTYDECGWDAIGERDRTIPLQFRSIWGDLKCSAEEGFTTGTTSLGVDEYKAFLAGKGLSEIRLDSSGMVTINGRHVLAQALSARMPESFQTDRPRYQVAVWLWNLPGHSFNISCYGPEGIFPAKLAMLIPIVQSIVVSAP